MDINTAIFHQRFRVTKPRGQDDVTVIDQQTHRQVEVPRARLDVTSVAAMEALFDAEA